MRKFSMFLTALITSFVMALAGLVASPIASASENGNGSISATFPLGSSVLTKSQKAAIKKVLASSGSDASFIVTGTAGKLPGVSDRWVQRLAKARAQAIKAYLVSLGVSNTRVTTQVKTTEIGIIPTSTGNYPTSASTVAVTNSAGTGSGGSSGSGGGGSTAIAPGAPTSVSATVGNARSVVSWTAPASDGGAAITSYTAYSTPGSYTCTTASTSCTVTGLSNGTAYTFVVAATNSAGTGSASTASSSITPAAPSCATGATCTVGDTGPGGGIVYYVDNSRFSCGSPRTATCNYLEVAPSGWNTGSDQQKKWATGSGAGSNAVTGIVITTGSITVVSGGLNDGSQIGLGFANSVAIVNQSVSGSNDTTTAAGAARAYTNNGKTDWHLPTTAELNLLCQWNRGVTQDVATVCTGGSLNGGTTATLSGFAGVSYWSSSESRPSGAFGQSFSSGTQAEQSKVTGLATPAMYARPIRAFAPLP